MKTTTQASPLKTPQSTLAALRKYKTAATPPPVFVSLFSESRRDASATPGDTRDALLAQIEELDALILQLADLEMWPPGMLQAVQDARRRMRPIDVPESIAEFRRLVDEAKPDDDRRTCRECANLSGRRCLAAWRGEIVAAREYEPIRDILRRCEGMRPVEYVITEAHESTPLMATDSIRDVLVWLEAYEGEAASNSRRPAP